MIHFYSKNLLYFPSRIILHARKIHHQNKLRSIGVIGAPVCKGQLYHGVDSGPDVIRNTGILMDIQQAGTRVQDYGNLAFGDVDCFETKGNIRNAMQVAEAARKISLAVTRSLQQNDICLILGGDHSLSLGSVDAHRALSPEVVVIWIDAHADLNPPQFSKSGSAHGMVLSFLLKELEGEMDQNSIPSEFGWVRRSLSSSKLAYIALRDIDEKEKEFISRFGIHHHTVQDIDAKGIKKVMEEVFDKLNPRLEHEFHVSFDIDALCSSIAPSTGTPVEGGLTLMEAQYIVEEIHSTGQLRALDMVEVNATLGSAEDAKKTVQAARDVLFSALVGTNVRERVNAGESAAPNAKK